MNLKEALSELQKVAEENNLSTPYIVGGVPRNILLKDLNNLNDVDITTGNDDVHKLADKYAERMGVSPKIFDDGHRRVYIDDFQIDFSSHAIYDDIDSHITTTDEPTDIERDSFSRDFTVNSIMLPLDFSRVIDPTGMGVSDIRDKVLRCPIDCDIVFSESPNRIMRAFYYAAKYNLKIDESVKKSIRKNLDLLDNVKGRYASKQAAEALRMKPEIIDDLIETGVLGRIPLSKDVIDMLVREKKLNKVL